MIFGFLLSSPLHCCFIVVLVLKLALLYGEFAVTGLHDMDEFVQSQLILAVSIQFFIYELVFCLRQLLQYLILDGSYFCNKWCTSIVDASNCCLSSNLSCQYHPHLGCISILCLDLLVLQFLWNTKLLIGFSISVDVLTGYIYPDNILSNKLLCNVHNLDLN